MNGTGIRSPGSLRPAVQAANADPRIVVTLLVYAYCKGVFSSRKVDGSLSSTHRVSGDRGRRHLRLPHDQRLPKDNLPHMKSLTVQTLTVCEQAGQVKLG